MSDEFLFEVWQEGICVASCWANSRKAALREGMHYFEVYRKDGPAELKEKIGRKRLTIMRTVTRPQRTST